MADLASQFEIQEPDPSSISGARLKPARTERGLTLEQLAEMSGISVSYLSRLEGGQRNLSYRMLVSIARALDMPTRQLMPVERHVPVIGTINSNLEVSYYSANLLLGVNAPDNWFKEMAALRIEAKAFNSLLWGWFVCFDTKAYAVDDMDVAKTVIATRGDGINVLRGFFRLFAHGSVHTQLTSVHGSDTVTTDVLRVSPVVAILSPEQAKPEREITFARKSDAK